MPTVIMLDGPLPRDLLVARLQQVTDAVVVDLKDGQLQGVAPLLPLESLDVLEDLQAPDRGSTGLKLVTCGVVVFLHVGSVCGGGVSEGRPPHLLQRSRDEALLPTTTSSHCVGLSCPYREQNRGHVACAGRPASVTA